jgi:hypothetical protein
MSGKVLSVSTDSYGDTTVRYHAPKFANFGDSMDELEQQHIRERRSQLRRDRKKVGKVGEVKKLAENVKNLSQQMESSLFDLIKEQLPKANQAGLTKAQQAEFEKLAGQVNAAKSFDDLMNSIEDDDEPEVAQHSNTEDEPDVLEVCLYEPLEWSPAMEKRVEAFLKSWPKLRPAVLKAVFEAYRDQYDGIWDFMGGHPADKIILPDPTEPAVIEQLFRITDIQLDEENAINLGATCTWDDEHGLCVRIEDGQVAGVGQGGDF